MKVLALSAVAWVGLVALGLGFAAAMEPGPSAARVTPAALRYRGDTPLAARLSADTVLAILHAAGWEDRDIPAALAVSHCESGWRPLVVGTAGELGIFQVHPVNLGRFDRRFGPRADPVDPYQNAVIAHDIFETGGWAPWSCGGVAARAALVRE